MRMVLTFMCCSSSNRSTKTFKPKKNIPEGSHQNDLMKHAAATLGSGNLRLAVSLPDGEDLNEWVAVNSKYMYICVLMTQIVTVVIVCEVLLVFLFINLP